MNSIDTNIIIDEATGLMWQQKTPDNKMTWEEAKLYCSQLNLAGFIDWRLPTIKELISIIDYNKRNPVINTLCFPETSMPWYLSDIVSIETPGLIWGIYFIDGEFGYPNKNGIGYVRAVRKQLIARRI